MSEILTCLKLLSLFSLYMCQEKQTASPVSEQFDLVLRADGPAGLPAFECKDLFRLWSVLLFTPYSLSSSFCCRMVIPLTDFIVYKTEDGTGT